jgi:hypothetical protein
MSNYIMSGLVAIVLSGALMSMSGCRFGNRVENADPVTDEITGYYETQAQSLQFCVTTNNNGTVCQSAPANQTPATVSSVMTDPVGLALQDESTGYSYLVANANSSNNSAIPIYADKSGEVSFVGNTTADTLFQDDQCTGQLFIEEEGSFKRVNPYSFQGFTTYGRLSVNISMITEVRGTCAASLQAMQNCYNDVNQCGMSTLAENASEQAYVQGVFGPYIQAGVMTSADILNVTDLAYEVLYQ